VDKRTLGLRVALALADLIDESPEANRSVEANHSVLDATGVDTGRRN
jgi:hypothetical protein